MYRRDVFVSVQDYLRVSVSFTPVGPVHSCDKIIEGGLIKAIFIPVADIMSFPLVVSVGIGNAVRSDTPFEIATPTRLARFKGVIGYEAGLHPDYANAVFKKNFWNDAD